MSAVKPTLRRMGLYYLLLAVNIIPCASLLPDRFPFRNVSTLYLLGLCVCLVLYYAHRVSPGDRLAGLMRTCSWMALLLILLRGVKYSAVSEVGVLARHAWYLYYVPMLLLPLCLFGVSLFVASGEDARRRALWRGSLALTAGLILLVLTNDLHRLVFQFRPGFRDWDRDYTRGWLFYAVTFWQYALYLTAILLLVQKCRVSSARRQAWLLLIPFALGTAMNVLLLTGKMPRINGDYLIEFPEALICTAAVVLECCIQLGLIPTNAEYSKLFRLFSISAQITDQAGTPVYVSHSAVPLTPEQFALENGARIGAHLVLHRMPLPGGFGFWQDDLTELDRLNDALAEAKDALAQEAELIRLRGEWKERQTKLEQRTLVYDSIARRTQPQSQAISRLAREARLSPDPARKERCRNRIVLLAAYIKRYANLTLLSQEQSELEAGELALSVSELLRCLNFCGIPGELVQSAACRVPAEAALAAFACLETLLEAAFPALLGVFVNLSSPEGALVFKITLEPPAESLPREALELAEAAGVRCELQREDEVSYLCLTLPRGGAAP